MKIYISWDINLIQQVRLIHALAESEYEICLHESELHKFSKLIDKFGIRLITPDTNASDISKALQISHPEPTTTIGKIARPLIFPHGVIEACRRIWSPERDIEVGFVGLVTLKRKQLLLDWIQANCNTKRPNLPNPHSFLNKAITKTRSILGMPTVYKKQIGPLQMTHSDRGRVFPIKSWDEDYFNLLGRTQFTLCPSGDCVWSYRFFEAALCGSIPIVEEACDAYARFKYYSFKDPYNTLEWDESIALHNFRTCTELLTINTAELNAELQNIAREASTPPHSIPQSHRE